MYDLYMIEFDRIALIISMFFYKYNNESHNSWRRVTHRQHNFDM